MITAIQKLTKAEKWLAEAKSLDDLKDIHDIAVAAEAYAKAHHLGLQAENHAMEIRLLAARRIGELVPAETGGRGKKTVRSSDSFPEKQRLSEFRKLAEIPMSQFKERIENIKEREGKINYNKMLCGDWYQTSESSEWETPQWLFDLLDNEFHFALDVCATEENAKCKKFFNKDDNGLSKTWTGCCWMNPPYGREIAQWMRKAVHESKNGITVVCLVPARTDTDWWWENVLTGEIRFLRGRLKWPGSDTAAPFPSAVIILRPNANPGMVTWWNVER